TGSKHQRIQFLGFRNDVHTILAASSLLVSPTRYEAYGLNVHEALCRNIPVLVSMSAGVAERFPTPPDADPVDMRFDDGICPDQLALRLEHWRDHQPQYAEKAEQAGSILRQHSWPERMAEWISCDSGS
ncbi:MAG: glycosyltransferase, partial [Planctomycetota bacterium]